MTKYIKRYDVRYSLGNGGGLVKSVADKKEAIVYAKECKEELLVYETVYAVCNGHKRMVTSARVF